MSSATNTSLPATLAAQVLVRHNGVAPVHHPRIVAALVEHARPQLHPQHAGVVHVPAARRPRRGDDHKGLPLRPQMSGHTARNHGLQHLVERASGCPGPSGARRSACAGRARQTSPRSPRPAACSSCSATAQSRASAVAAAVLPAAVQSRGITTLTRCALPHGRLDQAASGPGNGRPGTCGSRGRKYLYVQL